MRINILCDADWEAKIDKILGDLSNLGYRQFFKERSYGNSLEGVTIVLMCQDSSLNLKQRVRYSKKENKIYIDIMLDLIQMKIINQQQKNKIVANKITKEIPLILAKYKFEFFELEKFKQDLNVVFGNI